MRSYLLVASVGSALAVMAAAFPAHASAPVTAGSIRFSLRLSSHRLGYGSEVVLYIRMQTGARGQTAGVGLSASGWPERNVLGSAITFRGQRISGAGRITGGFGVSGGGYAAGPLCVRGTLQTGGGGPQVSLPPHSVTVLSYRVRLAAPPWPGLRPTVGAWAYVPAMGNGARAYRLGSLRLRTVGQTGVKISLTAKRGITRVNRYGGAVVHHGAKVQIAGRTDPPIAGANLAILAETGESPHVTRTTIGSVMTSSDGSFHIWWRPPHRGGYMVLARLSHPGPSYLPDRACDLSLIVH